MLEVKLWKDLYELQGWKANTAEIAKFETQLREKYEREVGQQQVEAKRKAEDQKEEEKKLRDLARRNSERFRTSAGRSGAGGSPSSPVAMDTSQEWISQGTTAEVDMNGIAQSTEESADMSFFSHGMPGSFDGRPIQSSSFGTDSTTADEDMGPSVDRARQDSLMIKPTLTAPGYTSPKINWAFLFKYRKRLEDNWLHNRYTTFQIPHPDYPDEGHGECIYTIQYSPNFLVSGSRDRTVRIWNMKTRRLRGPPLRGHNGSVLCLQFDESPEEDILITGSSDASVIIWRFSTGELLRTIERAHQESVLNLKFSKKWLVTCSKDKLIKVWSRQQLETTDPDYPWYSKSLFGNANVNEIRSHPHHPENLEAQAAWVLQDPANNSGISLRNPYASGGFVGTRAPPKGPAKTIAPYTTVQILTGHLAAVNAIQLHGDQVASASGDRLIKLWNLRTGTCEKSYLGHSKGIACIQFDGHTIVSGSSDQTIRVFDSATQAELATLTGHQALVRTVQATQNRIVSGSYDETVRIWRRDIDGQWTDSHVLRQAPFVPSTRGVPPQVAQAQAQMAALQQLQHAMPPAPVPAAAVHMHQVHQVGPALAGAVVTAQLLPNYHQPPHHAHTQHVPHHHHHLPQTVQPQAAAAHHPPVHPGGTHRVFKLQFDARWIICCSQDSKIIGWDFAAGDEGIIEASRFFKGGN